MNEFYYLSLGAGKQSSALALMIANKDSRLPTEFHSAKIIFSDTKYESDKTYEWIKELAQYVEIIWVDRGVGLLEFFLGKNKIPMGWVSPYCSSYFKRDRIYQYYAQEHGLLCKDNKKRLYGRRVKIHEIMGIGVEEFSRVKYPKKLHWLIKHYPLVDLRLKRNDCIEIIRGYLYPNKSFSWVNNHVPRSACTFCPNKSDSMIRNQLNKHPSHLLLALEVQQNAMNIRSENPPTWKVNKTLHEIMRSNNQDDTMEEDICDGGYCFV